MPKTTRVLFSAALLIAVLTHSSVSLPAMTARTFGQLSEEQRLQYFRDLTTVAQKVLRDAGRAKDAEDLGRYIGYQAFWEGKKEVDGPGWDWFVGPLRSATYQKDLAAIQDPAMRALQVEYTFFRALQKWQSITLPDAFLEIAKAGEIHETAEFVRYESNKGQYDHASGAIIDALAGLAPGGKPVEPDRARVLAAEAKYKADPVPENAMRMPLAEITTRWAGYPMIATGDVSRVETVNGSTNLHFQPDGNKVVVCFPQNTFSGLFGMKDITELVGKRVEVWGRITLPTACGGAGAATYGAVVPAAILIEAPSQMKVLGTASGTTTTSAPAQKEPIAVRNPDGTMTFQEPAAEGQEGKGLVIPPQVVIPIVGGTTAPDNSAAEAARAKALQEEQERYAQQQAAAQQEARQRAEEGQRQAQKAIACTQQLMKDYPDGGRSDPAGFQKGFLACVQAQQAQPSK